VSPLPSSIISNNAESKERRLMIRRQWQKVVGAKPRTMTPAEVRETIPSDPDLACPICKKVIWEAVKTPCCSTSYCEECVTNWLMDHEFVCESCESKVGSLEELAADEELREKVGEYIEGEIVRSKREKEEEDEQAGIVGGDTGEQAESTTVDGVKAEPEAGEEGAGQEESQDKKVSPAGNRSGERLIKSLRILHRRRKSQKSIHRYLTPPKCKKC